MPVAVSVGRQDKPLQEAYGFVAPSLYQDQVSYWGIRDLDPGEISYLAEHAPDVAHSNPTLYGYSMDVIKSAQDSGKFEALVQDFTAHIGKKVVASFDVDGLDPVYSSATGTAVPGGMTLTQALYVMAQIQNKAVLAGMDIVEVNPLLADVQGQETTLSTAGLVAQFPTLNKTILEIADAKGAPTAAQSLTDYCGELNSMRFDRGWGFRREHVSEAADVILKNLSQTHPGFSAEAAAKALRSIQGSPTQ